MECRSIGVLGSASPSFHYSITPTLHYSILPYPHGSIGISLQRFSPMIFKGSMRAST